MVSTALNGSKLKICEDLISAFSASESIYLMFILGVGRFKSRFEMVRSLLGVISSYLKVLYGAINPLLTSYGFSQSLFTLMGS